MEYAEENLGQILPQRALTPEEIRDLLEPALDTLAFIHSKSLAHGRLKPSNIMAAGDQLKLSSDSLSGLTSRVAARNAGLHTAVSTMRPRSRTGTSLPHRTPGRWE